MIDVLACVHMEGVDDDGKKVEHGVHEQNFGTLDDIISYIRQNVRPSDKRIEIVISLSTNRVGRAIKYGTGTVS